MVLKKLKINLKKCLFCGMCNQDNNDQKNLKENQDNCPAQAIE